MTPPNRPPVAAWAPGRNTRGTERVTTDSNSNGAAPADEPTTRDADEAGTPDVSEPTFADILRDSRIYAGLRTWAAAKRPFSAGECELYGCLADGSPALGGYTDAGRAFGEHIAAHIDEANDEAAAAARRGRRRGRRAAGPVDMIAGSIGDRIVDDLDIAGPIRAALRAGAQAFAAALNDGEADDDGIDDDEVSRRMAATGEFAYRNNPAGGYTLRLPARGPFVVLQLSPSHDGSPFGGITVCGGGGAQYRRELGDDDDMPSIEQIVELAAAGVKAYAEHGPGLAVVDAGDDVPDDVAEAFVNLLRGQFPPGANIVDGTAAGRQRRREERQRRGGEGGGGESRPETLADVDGLTTPFGGGSPESPTPAAPQCDTGSTPASPAPASSSAESGAGGSSSFDSAASAGD